MNQEDTTYRESLEGQLTPDFQTALDALLDDLDDMMDAPAADILAALKTRYPEVYDRNLTTLADLALLDRTDREQYGRWYRYKQETMHMMYWQNEPHE